MEMNGQFHAPAALSPGKEPPTRAPDPIWKLWSREESLAPAGIRTPTVQPVARHFTDWAHQYNGDNYIMRGLFDNAQSWNC
jgi:hypothetical protein